MKVKELVLPFLLLVAILSCKKGTNSSKEEDVVVDPVVEPVKKNPIVEFATENITEGKLSYGDGDASCESVTAVTFPVRAGNQSFKHSLGIGCERAEFEFKNAPLNSKVMYGWSMYLPDISDGNPYSSYIVNQFAAYPSNRNFKLGCGGVGTKFSISQDILYFDFQHKGKTVDIQCDQINLGNVAQFKGKWVDFVMETKWTGNADGYLKLWMKIGNDPYVQKVDYTGATYWNDEGSAPYFKMGVYLGKPDWRGLSPRTVYFDEYKRGDSTATFKDVSPAGLQ